MSPTSSDISISLLGQTYGGKNTSYYMMWYHVAGFLWTLFTLIGLSQLTVAGAVAEWYWTQDKSKKLGRLPVTQSAWRAIRYHLGSVIIGALLITIVELIRLFLYQLQKQIASSKNPYLKYLVACAQCCMKCVEVILKWVNRHAYGTLFSLTNLSHLSSIYCNHWKSLFRCCWCGNFSFDSKRSENICRGICSGCCVVFYKNSYSWSQCDWCLCVHGI